MLNTQLTVNAGLLQVVKYYAQCRLKLWHVVNTQPSAGWVLVCGNVFNVQLIARWMLICDKTLNTKLTASLLLVCDKVPNTHLSAG